MRGVLFGPRRVHLGLFITSGSTPSLHSGHPTHPEHPAAYNNHHVILLWNVRIILLTQVQDLRLTSFSFPRAQR